jgi:head-tail adaptor
VTLLSFGKMNTFIEIICTEQVKDGDGFAVSSDAVLASVRAYMEERHGTKIWANRAAFSTATCLFRFRKIPSLDINATLYIACPAGRFRILSVEDVRGRGMYIEILAEKVEASKNGAC